MADTLIMANILDGITKGLTQGMQLRQQKDQLAKENAFKQQEMDLKREVLKQDEDEKKRKVLLEPTFEEYSKFSPGQKKAFEEFKGAGKSSRAEGLKEYYNYRLPEKIGIDAQAALKDKLVVEGQAKLNKVENARETLNEALAGKNQMSYAAAKALIPRILGEVGVMTDQDIQRYSESPAMSRRIKDKLKLLTSGSPTKDTINDLKEIMTFMEKGQKRLVEARINQQINIISKKYRVDPAQVKDYFMLESGAYVPEAFAPGAKTRDLATTTSQPQGQALKPDVIQNGITFTWDQTKNKYVQK